MREQKTIQEKMAVLLDIIKNVID